MTGAAAKVCTTTSWSTRIEMTELIVQRYVMVVKVQHNLLYFLSWSAVSIEYLYWRRKLWHTFNQFSRDMNVYRSVYSDLPLLFSKKVSFAVHKLYKSLEQISKGVRW